MEKESKRAWKRVDTKNDKERKKITKTDRKRIYHEKRTNSDIFRSKGQQRKKHSQIEQNTCKGKQDNEMQDIISLKKL